MSSRKLEYEFVGKSDTEQVTKKAAADIGVVDQAIHKFQYKLKNIGNQIGKSLFHMFGPLMLAHELFGFISKKIEEANTKIKEAVDFGSSLERNAREAGTTIEMYQRMRSAAQEVGFSQEEINNAFKRSRQAIVEAKDEHSKYFQILKALGFAKEEILAGNIKEEEMITRVAAAINSTTDPIEKMRIETAAYGADAEKLVGVLGRWKDIQDSMAGAKPITDPVAKILANKKQKEEAEKAKENVEKATNSALTAYLKGEAGPISENVQKLVEQKNPYGSDYQFNPEQLAEMPDIKEAILADLQRQMAAEKAAEKETNETPEAKAAADALKAIPDKTASATAESFKSPEGFSNVVGVGANPVIEAMTKQLEAQLEANRLLEAIAANIDNSEQGDFTKDGYHGDMSD